MFDSIVEHLGKRVLENTGNIGPDSFEYPGTRAEVFEHHVLFELPVLEQAMVAKNGFMRNCVRSGHVACLIRLADEPERPFSLKLSERPLNILTGKTGGLHDLRGFHFTSS